MSSAAMEIDKDPPPPLSPDDRIIQRLTDIGVPVKELLSMEPGLLLYMEDNKFKLSEVVYAILPGKDIVEEVGDTLEDGDGEHIGMYFSRSLEWLQWLMFEGEPEYALRKLAEEGIGQGGVCGYVWGKDDITYHCKTCENDPTCAICVTCFQNGNHKDHDYSLGFSGGGCCDCGDVTAWKREGFCSNHKGVEQIQPLPKEIANCVGPVLDMLLRYWSDKLVCVHLIFEKKLEIYDYLDHFGEHKKIAEELTHSIVEMLLNFCKCSGSFLNFVAKRVFPTVGLLDVLVRAERFLNKEAVKQIHELLLKFLAEPTFKFEFAKVFLIYYPGTIMEGVKDSTDTQEETYPLISTFTVQIFTVPTLTPLLVKERNMLGVLFECLRDVFAFAEEEGHIQVSKWTKNMYDNTIRLVGDTRYVMSHVEVPKYVINEQKGICRTWIQLLTYMQAVDPQKRVLGLHVEEENENIDRPFFLGDRLAKITSLLVAGASSDTVDEALFGSDSHLSISSSITWLTYECLRAIEKWLGCNVATNDFLDSSRDKCVSSNTNFVGLNKTSSRIKKGKSILKVYKTPLNKSRSGISSEPHTKIGFSSTYCGTGVESNNLSDMDCEQSSTSGRNDHTVGGVLGLSEWPDIVYDVSVQDISLFIPLHRLLSMLLQNSLETCYGESGGKDMTSYSLLHPGPRNHHDFFGKVLWGCHPLAFSAFLMEHPLRIRVFCGQVRAGMWRKNGDAAISSCEWYHSVPWSERGPEYDLFLLQCCAALAPPDLYIERILDRFGLSYYLTLNLERSCEYEPFLVQEMLTLIIQLVKERRFCGLSPVDSLKREMIYKLAIGDATRSELIKSLPRDIAKNSELQNILDDVAVYTTASGLKQGKYALRGKCWKELDLYHPRWNPRDLQVAEERYLWFNKVSALNTQLPRWTKVFDPLNGISRIATSKSILKIVHAVLFYAVFSNKSTLSRTPDGLLIIALHLISLSLNICDLERQSNVDYFPPPLLEFAGQEIISGPGFLKSQSLLSLLVTLMRNHMKENVMEASDVSSLIKILLKRFAQISVDCAIELKILAPELVWHLSDTQPTLESSSKVVDLKTKARERQAAVLAKMKAAQSKFMENLNYKSNEEVDASESNQEMPKSDNDHIVKEHAPFLCSLCRDPDSESPVSFLILLQKSRLMSFMERVPPSWEHSELDKGHISITSENTESNVEYHIPEMSSSFQLVNLIHNALNEFANDGLHIEVNAFLEYIKARVPAARGIHLPDASHVTSMTAGHSIEMVENLIHQSVLKEMQDSSESLLLHAEENLIDSSIMVSKLLGKYIALLPRETYGNYEGEIPSLRSSDLPLSFDRFGPENCDGIYMSSCGHALHQTCRDRYLSSLRERYASRIVFQGGNAVDPDQGEFLCPICRRLANSVLPAFPFDSWKSEKQMMLSIRSSEPTRPSNHFRIKQALSVLQSAVKAVVSSEVQKTFTVSQRRSLPPPLESVFSLLCKMYFLEKKDLVCQSRRVSYSMILWDTLKYTLISTEISSRSRITGLEALYRELQSSSGFALSLLLKVGQSARSDNDLQMLLRLRGILLFAGSVCSGVSIDRFFESARRQQGSISSVLDHLDKGVEYPDNQFWKRAADPILSNDPFSSLMWVLFSFPGVSLSDANIFFPLIHLFYAVCVVQALFACQGKYQLDITEFGFPDCPEIFSVLHQQFFTSNYIDSSCPVKDMIRRLSHPYLRRCALLWKLLKSPIPVPFSDTSYKRDESSHVNKKLPQRVADISVELKEIEELENFFEIPALDIILKEKILHRLSSKWSNHICAEFGSRNVRHNFYCSPAVSFSLMRLPYLYQDLLERYIKAPCPQCKKTMNHPALCLLCGKICSSSWQPCCRESGRRTHAMSCGAGIGVFLLIKKTIILLQRSEREARWPSPYLDAFGEEDFDLRRGKPLYLNEERYTAITNMVSTYGFDQSSEVLRQTATDPLF